MQTAVDLLRQQAAQIEQRFWEVAITQYGLEPNTKTVDRIHCAMAKYLREAYGDVAPALFSRYEEAGEPVHDGIALAFMAIATIQMDIEQQRLDSAMQTILVAAEALGVLRLGPMPQGLRSIVERCESVDIGSVFATALAKRRHAENDALIDYALKYWREKIDPSLSASKAANELVRVVNLSHKKLASVVSAEKKRQP